MLFDSHQLGTAMPRGGHPPHQIQALDRTQPGLPIKPGRCGTMTHDYKRNGTTTLFAAFNVLDGTVIGQCMQRHRHQEFIRFLNGDRARRAGRQGDPRDPRQLCRPQARQGATMADPAPALDFHFTPTSCSWLNAVETFFAKLTRRRLKRGVFPSLIALQEAINRFIAAHNRDPKPFVWTPTPRDHRRRQKRVSSV